VPKLFENNKQMSNNLQCQLRTRRNSLKVTNKTDNLSMKLPQISSKLNENHELRTMRNFQSRNFQRPSLIS